MSHDIISWFFFNIIVRCYHPYTQSPSSEQQAHNPTYCLILHLLEDYVQSDLQLLSSLRSKCQDQRALETTEARDSHQKPFNAEEDLTRFGSKIIKAYPKSLTKIHPFYAKGGWGNTRGHTLIYLVTWSNSISTSVHTTLSFVSSG